MDQSSEEPSIWTVYQSPLDYPGEFVARRWVIGVGVAHATDEVRRADTLENLRRILPPGLYRLPRQRGDEPQIVESWV